MTTHHLATVQQAERARRAVATVTVDLPPDLDPDRARPLVTTLIQRHELLRSRLVPAPGGAARLVQEIADEAVPTWRHTGDRDWPVEGTLGVGPLRVAVTTAGPPIRLRFSLPASYADLGGLATLAHELWALAEGRALPVPVQNSQYAAWQAETELAQPPDPAAVRGLFPAPGAAGPSAPEPEHGGRYERRRVRLPAPAWAPVPAAAAQLGVGIDAFLLAGWLITLARYGEAGTVGGYADHRRVYGDLADTVGVLSRYLPVSVELTGDARADEVIQRVARGWADVMAALDAFSWQLFPPGAFPCDSRAPRRPCLFAAHRVASAAVLEHATIMEPSHAPALSVQVLYTDTDGLVEVLYDPAVTPAARAGVLGDHYATLLADLAERSDNPVGELRLLDTGGQQRVLAGYGHAPERLPPGGGTAHRLIAEQVARTPDRVAVTDGARRWTYAQLHARAGQIAAMLRHHGVPPGGRVALALERRADLVAAVLGAWQAGTAYVPIDTGTPAERMAFILADSAAAVLLTDLAELPVLPDHAPTVLPLTEQEPEGPAEPVHAGDPTDLAYIIYTSGTTGRPKGVMIEHGSVVNLARAHRERVYRHHDAGAGGLRASLNAPLPFDGAVERILLLASGHTLFIVDEEARRDPAAFVAFARRHDLQILDVTPSFLTAAIQAGLLEQPGYRPLAVLVGGEAIGPALWRTLAASPVAFYNVYGPTETTVNAAVGPVVGDTPHLGQALPNVRLYIVDAARRPVPPGVPGEIRVAGAGVGRGYLNQPELTARTFTANPFAPDDPMYGRWYATGDLGRFLPDGSIGFLGRNDGQLKLRGFRIETGEITSLLCQDPDVVDALVRLRGADPERRELVAYVVAPVQVHGGLPERLRARLAEQLPAYAVPSSILALPAWPLTGNAKVDVDALPEPGGSQEAPPSTHVAPRGETEVAVARIWAEVLGRAGIGATDNFFEVGGHSLLVPVMLRRVADEFQVPLPLRTIFVAATVTDLARKVDEERAGR